MRQSLRLTPAQMAAFAERLKNIRMERKLTQGRLAELLGVGTRVYHRWENGDATPHLDTLVKIAEVLQVSADELLGIEDVRAEHRIHNHELHRLYSQVDSLSDDAQQALIVILDGLVKRASVKRMVEREAVTAPRKPKRGPTPKSAER
jgi:transcriptional regulator with XRE-family HTH domain